MQYAAPAPTTANDLPDGARWLDELAPDSAEYAFTLDQTDSNQHVNSLVYIRVFHDAINRRLVATGRPMRMRSRAVDIAYRKPCFAGDKVRASLRLFEHDGGLGAAGLIAGDDGKPRCYVRVLLGT
jgi:acyl-ACP thioesterase